MTNKCKSKKSQVYYNRDKDYVQIFFEHGRGLVKRIDDFLSVYQSNTEEIIGCELRNITELLQILRKFITLEENLNVRWLFLAAATHTSNKLYAKLSRLSDATIPVNELPVD